MRGVRSVRWAKSTCVEMVSLWDSSLEAIATPESCSHHRLTCESLTHIHVILSLKIPKIGAPNIAWLATLR
jgi:hypothetical protein